MTTEQERRLLEFMKDVIEQRNGLCSYDDIEDFCDENDIPSDEAFEFIDKERVPLYCKGCKHIGMFSKFYPCNVCSRPCKDMYEKG